MGMVSPKPQMKIAQLAAVRTIEFKMASIHLNSLPASAAITMSNGSANTMPTKGSAMPKTITDPTIVINGFQAILPIGSPPSVSMVSDLNSTMAPRIAMITLSNKGK